MVCSGCFSAVPRLLELERREAVTYEKLARILDAPDPKPLIRDIIEKSYADGDLVYHDCLTEARRILHDVAEDLQARKGNTHAASAIFEHGETFYACSMPGCKLCGLSSRASSFLERQGWLY